MARVGALACLIFASLSLDVSGTQHLTCPSSSIEVGLAANAAGATVFAPHSLPGTGACQNMAVEIPKGAQFKLCGPGKWTVSRMSCERHGHKSVVIVHPTNSYTISDCEVYNFADYYEIDEYVGSATFTCDTTAR